MIKKRYRFGIPVVAIAIAVAWFGTPGLAQEVDHRPRIGVVDLQRILRESTAAAKVRTEIEAQQKQYREQIGARETALRAQQEELERQRTILSAEAFAQREADFSKDVEALQRDVVERNRQLEEHLSYGMQQIQVAALRIIAEIADAMELGLVLDKSQLLLVAKGLEFSDQALAKLNEALPTVSTTPPADSE